MVTTRQEPVSPYLGADLSDRYAKSPRANDVCGVTPTGDGGFGATFHEWLWDPPGPLDVTAILDELRAARCSMLDGPQGLARPEAQMREWERTCGALAQTSAQRPALAEFCGGYVNASLDLFAALRRAGGLISPVNGIGAGGAINEYYPGVVWPVLAGGQALPSKKTPRGRRVRQAILRALGVRLPERLMTHDENDACLGALLAAAADGAVQALGVSRCGRDVYTDAAGILREGPIWLPVPDEAMRERLRRVVRETLSVAESARTSASRAGAEPRRTRAAQPMPPEPPDGWQGPVTLCATDHYNLWRKSRGAVVNGWLNEAQMEGWRLWVRLANGGGVPAVLFVPFSGDGSRQQGMKVAPDPANRGAWKVFVAAASGAVPVYREVQYRYESLTGASCRLAAQDASPDGVFPVGA